MGENNWLRSLGRISLADLGLLVVAIIWLVTPHPDTELRAQVEELRKTKQDIVAARAEKELILGRLDDIKQQLHDVQSDVKAIRDREEKSK